MHMQTEQMKGIQGDDVRAGWRAGQLGWAALALFSVAVVAFLAFYNLTDYPRTWFDEGSHLHVPKALVTMGVYADYSSEGLRHFGPTIGVGPTVMLPIAAAFELFGIGLMQARLVIVIYMLAAIAVLFRLSLTFGDRRFAWIATALVVTSQGVSLVYYGRQVLGEVPGLLFLLGGLVLWFAAGERAGYAKLSLIGLLFGLAVVTKNQYLLLMVPTIGIAWVVNLIYYRLMPQRFFIVPGIVMGICYALWQVYIVLYLGPDTAMENLVLLRNATAGAALVFSPELMKQSFGQLFGLNLYLGWLLPALLYAFFQALPRNRKSQFLGILVIFTAFNLLWFVVA
ncbi:MAG: glycosyltransferase family 39 protein [Caldilineaceae bacterium]|nr:glycosyltransferase family 39 protein [Caldilineaceae bacterium]